MDMDIIKSRVGEFFNGLYSVEKFLGEGAFAEVFLVKHIFLDDLRVMKIIKEPFNDSFNLDTIFHEVRIAYPLKHENIINIHDAGIISTGGENSKDFVYFIMEYVPSGDLNQYVASFINSDTKTPLYWVFTLIKQILFGLNILHSSDPPIVHGDLKPGNLLLGFNSQDHAVVKLTDFGFAKELSSNSSLFSVVGTRLYMAPECFHKKFYPSTDIYAVGVIFYLFLTNKFPFDMKNFEIWDILDGKPWECELIPPSKFNPEVSFLLDEIVMKCLSFNHEDRFGNAKELFKEVNKCMNSYSFDDNTYKMSKDVTKAFRLAKYENKLPEAIELLEKHDMDMMFEETISKDEFTSSQNTVFLKDISELLELKESNSLITLTIKSFIDSKK